MLFQECGCLLSRKSAEAAQAGGSTLREAALEPGEITQEPYDKIIVPGDMIGHGVGDA